MILDKRSRSAAMLAVFTTFVWSASAFAQLDDELGPDDEAAPSAPEQAPPPATEPEPEPTAPTPAEAAAAGGASTSIAASTNAESEARRMQLHPTRASRRSIRPNRRSYAPRIRTITIRSVLDRTSAARC